MLSVSLKPYHPMSTSVALSSWVQLSFWIQSLIDILSLFVFRSVDDFGSDGRRSDKEEQEHLCQLKRYPKWVECSCAWQHQMHSEEQAGFLLQIVSTSCQVAKSAGIWRFRSFVHHAHCMYIASILLGLGFNSRDGGIPASRIPWDFSRGKSWKIFIFSGNFRHEYYHENLTILFIFDRFLYILC